MRKRTGLGIAAAFMIGAAVLGMGSASGAILPATPHVPHRIGFHPAGQVGIPVPVTVIIIIVLVPGCPPPHIPPPHTPPSHLPPPHGVTDKAQTVLSLKVLPRR